MIILVDPYFFSLPKTRKEKKREYLMNTDEHVSEILVHKIDKYQIDE